MLACKRTCAHKSVLAIVRWLHEQAHCAWNAMALATRAVETDNVSLLSYMKDQGTDWTEYDLTELLDYGGKCCENTATLQWLRDEGADWPDEIYADNGYEEYYVEEPWSDAALQWAISQDCPNIIDGDSIDGDSMIGDSDEEGGYYLRTGGCEVYVDASGQYHG